MKNTVGHTGIYAWGDHVKLKLLQQCSGRRNKNPLLLGMGECQADLDPAKAYYVHDSSGKYKGIIQRFGVK